MSGSDNDALGDASGCQRAQKRPQQGVNTYPLLYKLGLWFAFIPLSVVAVGRAIGLMREIETPKRNRLKEPQCHAESFLRYNK